MIEVSDLRKTFDGTEALAGFSLRIEAGELCGLVGPNGAGKTTLLRILAALIAPDQGDARIDGLDVTEEGVRGDVKKRIGFMPDHAGIYQDMRVEEFLRFFADAFLLPREEKAAAIERAIAQAGLADRRNGYIEELSMGMRQRLLLAKTLLHQPRVLLLDEPATGLDPLARIELREHLRRLNREGTTIFLSSHILADLEDICTRVVFIDEGRNVGDDDRSAGAGQPSGAEELLCEIEYLGEPATALAAVQSHPGAAVRAEAPGKIRAVVAGGAKGAADLLKKLIEAGVSVTKFNPRGTGLEDRYQERFGRDSK